jgi:hypothetical protein
VKKDVCKKGFSCGLACISRSASCRQFLRGQIGFYRTLSPVAREVYKAYTKALKALREEAPNQFNDLQAALAGGLEYRLGSLATPTGIVTAAAVRAFINRVEKVTWRKQRGLWQRLLIKPLERAINELKPGLQRLRGKALR